MKKGFLTLISGSSGVGKNTVISKLKEKDKDIMLLRSCTSRDKRVDDKVQEDGETAFDESFKFNSQVDPVNKLASSTIDINKDGEKELTVNYLRNEDLYGLKFKDIVNQYVVFENNNLKEFVAKFGVVDTTNIPDKIDLSEMLQNVNQEEVSLEELKSIGNKYVNIIIEEVKKLPENNF